MKPSILGSILVTFLLGTPVTAMAVSAVFNGDPVNAATGLPYEILPGLPLVQPGPDGLLGTADDIVDPTIIGDIDMVVRSGSPAATSIIPAPNAQVGGAALPIAVAGSSAGGGTDIPFTVFLSDGVASDAAPSGHLLAAADMDGIPVIVAAFADSDGDGFIGPTDQDVSGPGDNCLEVRELEPIGRGVGLFSGGVARGSVAVHAGLPASRGGLKVVLAAIALTGPFDAAFFSGNIPSGPAISTALPFLPQRDLTKLIRDRPVPVGPGTTLQEVIAFAALPTAGAGAPFALPLDGSSPTIDVAVVNSQPATRAAFREDVGSVASRESVAELVLGNQLPANQQRLRIAPVDRWGNPTDPPAGFAVTLRTSGVVTLRPTRARVGAVKLRSASGLRLVLRVPVGTPDGTTGTVSAEHDGMVVGSLTYRVDVQANRQRPDLVVPSGAATIQAAIDSVTDTNSDGALVIAVKPGVYRENVTVDRTVVLQGDSARTTIIQGNGAANVVSVTAPNVRIQGLTAVGGSSGFALTAASPVLAASRAWRNIGAGVSVGADGARVSNTAAFGNGGDGVLINGANSAVCSANDLFDNAGAGINVSGGQHAQLDNNEIAANAGAGIRLGSAISAMATDNHIGNNLGSGIQMLASQDAQVIANLCAVNDEDGINIDSKLDTGGGSAFRPLKSGGGNPTTSNLVSGNIFDANHGYGMFVRRSPDDDFDAAVGTQAPPGDNAATNNRKGEVLVRTN